MASPQPREEDYNLPSEERRALLQRFQEALGDVPPHFWAACQLCDMKSLEALVKSAECCPDLLGLVIGQTGKEMIAYWNQSALGSSRTTTPQTSPRFGASGSSSTGSVSSLGGPYGNSPPPAKRRKTSIDRSELEREKAATRDGFACVLTLDDICEVAHIYPFCLLKEENDAFGNRHIFWRHLQLFWPKEKITAWQEQLFPGDTYDCGIETAKNLITLSVAAHRLWNKGAFALKPISVSDDHTTLKVQFFWQIKQPEVETQPTISLLTTPSSTKDLERSGRSRLVHADLSDGLLKSGNIFEIKTDDPDKRPLPSFELLEMQWFLQRVTGMAGAVDVEVDLGKQDPDDDIEDFQLDEVVPGQRSRPGQKSSSDAADESPPTPNADRYRSLSIEGSKYSTEEDEEQGGVTIVQY